MIGQATLGRALGALFGLTALSLLLVTTGCNTMRGVGEDIEAAGSGISGTAESTEETIEEEMDDEEQQ
jgi:predicted small secreted protein